MKFIFRKEEKGLFPALIRWWTKSPYSHCAVLLNEELMFEAAPGAGTRFVPVGPLLTGDWDALEIKTSADDDQAVLTFCQLEDRLKYDWKGIFFSQIIKMQRAAKNEWFCSEIATAIAQRIGYMINNVPCTVDPGKLYKRLKEAGAAPCVL